MSSVELSERIVFAPLLDEFNDNINNGDILSTNNNNAASSLFNSGSFVIESDDTSGSLLGTLVDDSIYLDDVLNSTRVYASYALLVLSIVLVVYTVHRLYSVHWAGVYGNNKNNTGEQKQGVHRSALLKRKQQQKHA